MGYSVVITKTGGQSNS